MTLEQYASIAEIIGVVVWMSYRGVIFFLLGTRRARELWSICSPYFNPEYAEMVAGMVDGIPITDFWEKLEAVR